ncbi:hypothetical protein ETD85_46420, partial [Nonomuraea zeae]
MRGQEPGSEHDRREADGSAAPATPPPSFGQTNGRDVPPAFTDSDEAADAEARPVVPTYQGPPPYRSEPEVPAGVQPWKVPDDDATPPPGVQPWEVSDDDAAVYDWFADPEQTDPDGPDRPGLGLPDGIPSISSPADHVHPGQPQLTGQPPAGRPAAG